MYLVSPQEYGAILFQGDPLLYLELILQNFKDDVEALIGNLYRMEFDNVPFRDIPGFA